MNRWAPYLVAALIAGVVFLWWISRGEAAVEPTEPIEGDLGDLTKLPNYRPPGDNMVTFADHTDFVRTLSDAFQARFPARGARGLLIAHAATAGWHLPGRTPLYWWNLWGELISEEYIRRGDVFTVLKASGGKYWPYRAFTSPRAAMERYLVNAGSYGTGAVSYLDGRGDDLTEAECRRYVELIKPWFAVAQRTPEELDKKAYDFIWIWRNKIRPVIA